MHVSLPSLLGNLDQNAVLREVKKSAFRGELVCEIITQLQEGMDTVMERYETGDYYIADLMIASDIFAAATDLINILAPGEKAAVSTFVIGSIHGDIHDIGKNIVASVLKCSGFKVIDLGVDVSANKFMAAIREYNPQFVGISCLLTASINRIKEAIAAIEEAGLRQNLRILIGGSPVDKAVGEYVKADAVCLTPKEAVDYARSYYSAQYDVICRSGRK